MDYLPIRVSTLRGDQKLDFNAYVKVNDKYILYVRQGDSFEGARLSRLKEKKLKKMFILPEDEGSYRTYLSRNIEMAYDKNSGKSIVTRAEIIQGSQQSNVEEVMDDPGSVEAYNTTKDAAGQFVNFIMNEDEALTSIMNIQNVDQNIAHHGVTVSTLSVALAQKLGSTADSKNNQLLALGSLLHDIGHAHSNLQINRELKSMTPEELVLYKKHTEDGAQLVLDKKHFDKQVVNIIMQHEEIIDGSGFPRGLRESQTDPLAVIVSSANALDRLITFEKVPIKQAVKKLTIEQVGCHPLNHIQLLGEILANVK